MTMANSIPKARFPLRTLHTSEVGLEAVHAAVRRTTLQDNPAVEATVKEIVARVRNEGDSVLMELSRKFDSPVQTRLEIPYSEWDDAEAEIADDVRFAIVEAAANIRAFHEKQLRQSWMDVQPDKITGQLVRPLQRVGFYVPGGTACYPSSLLMTVIPARVAGVSEVVLCTPAQANGTVLPEMLFAARMAGVSRIFMVGGAQAVAAMAFGTETIPAVDKIVGPGNIYVNIAKKTLWGQVDIDMLAGPSEVCVIADEFANPKFAALDMLTQAEHDVEAAAYLITPCEKLAKAVEREIEAQLKTLPRRDILKEALERQGAIIITNSLREAYEVANVCAPEHLSLMIREPFAALGHIRNAGAILLGDYSPQTLGDYLAGPSHTLPTSGTARFASPLNVDTFLKKTSVIYYTANALNEVTDSLAAFARREGFEAHAEAALARKSDK